MEGLTDVMSCVCLWGVQGGETQEDAGSEQDMLEGVMLKAEAGGGEQEVQEALEEVAWRVQRCSGLFGEGLMDGLHWLWEQSRR